VPKRNDIKKIMIVGSGPIVIGQACEFDYSGVQACKALREEGYELVLVNSNPATIMTDPEFADRTYIEPLSVDILTEIVRRERPDALLPTVGGQTALNLSLTLHEAGTLARYAVELLGARPEVINKAEDRGLFREAMARIGLDQPRSISARSYEDTCRAREALGAYPLIIRPGFTLGGTGGGIARNDAEFDEVVRRGLHYSPASEVLVEESVLGWKEFEMEMMRDRNDNCVIVCSIENVDAMGVHTGDSITVAPALTLTDREYQRMRDAAIAVMREIGVDTGGSNVQFAVNPRDGRMVVIEMNPRVSRSSALASKATGFPIAKIAAKLAVGYTLDELRNDITRETPACFEPAIDYVVTKIPRFAFEKFAGADDHLNTQMKSVGEAMSIGKTFKQSFQKALRSLETGRAGFGADGKDERFDALSDEALAGAMRQPSSTRIFAIRAALKRGWTIERVHKDTGIDPWFLDQWQELAEFEEDIAEAGNLEGLKQDLARFRHAKEFGYSDRQIAFLLGTTEAEVRDARAACDLLPVYGLVDTCAAEFRAFTPYFYSTYGRLDESRPSDRRKVMILGGGPNRIGQGIEFDYCCVHASFALRDAGFETIMVNSNPETVSTDYDTSDRLYFEPLTVEDVLHIYQRERCWGAIVQFGGQTPLNLAHELERNGVNIIGTRPESIDIAEDRERFADLVTSLDLKQPPNGMATNIEEAEAIAERLGYPVLVRPSFVLGGRAMAIVYDRDRLRSYMEEAVDVFESRPVLIDQFLDHAVEVDVDCISDGETTVIGGIMEHVELAGIHSGDSACVIPAPTLDAGVKAELRRCTQALAETLNVCGLMNVQYAIRNGDIFVLEVNPRASRTVPFVSKATGIPLARLAALAMAGFKLKDMGFTEAFVPRHISAKEAVFPFAKFPGVDVILSPEMKSTGEVMGIDIDAGMAFLKSQVAAGNTIPADGNVFISVRDSDKQAMLPLARRLFDMGFHVYATRGTSTMLHCNGVSSAALFRISEGNPNVLDMIEDGNMAWIINTPSVGHVPRADEQRMRSHAVVRGIPITTTVDGARTAIDGLEAFRTLGRMEVCSLQEYSRHAPVLRMPRAKDAP
jgi:carbamoyl-phosphate synthase large subunit